MLTKEREKYEDVMKRLKGKLVTKKQLTNREDGYNEGIRTALSIVRSAWKSEEVEDEYDNSL